MKYGADSNSSNYISLRWNEMERRLQGDYFWCFLSNDNPQTRIDILFDFLTRRSKKIPITWSDNPDEYTVEKEGDVKTKKSVKELLDLLWI